MRRPFQFPDRRIARAADGIWRDAGAGLTAVALDFHPAVEALAIEGEAVPGRRTFPSGLTKDSAGNLPPMPGVLPGYPAPIVRPADGSREQIIMRGGMPPAPRGGGFGTRLPSPDHSFSE